MGVCKLGGWLHAAQSDRPREVLDQPFIGRCAPLIIMPPCGACWLAGKVQWSEQESLMSVRLDFNDCS